MGSSDADALMNDIRTLSPAQLRQTALYVKNLRSCGSVLVDPIDDVASKRPVSQATYQSPTDIFLTLYAADLRIHECDEAAEEALGSRQPGKPFLECVDPEYYDAATHAFGVIRSHKEIRNVRLRLLRGGGPSFPVIMAGRWVDADAADPAFIDIVCRDISYLKRIGNLQIFSEMLSVGIVLVDDHGQIAFANSSAETIFGYEQGQLEHKTFASLFPDLPEAFRPEHLIDPLHDHHPRIEPECELHGRTKSGSTIYLKVGRSSIRLDNHRFAVATVTDITVRKSIEVVLRKHEEQRALIFSEGLLGDFTWNIERDELVAHPTIFKLYGSRPIACPVPGQWFRDRQHPDDRPDIEKKWLSQIETGGELAVEFRVTGDDGIVRWIDCRGIVIRDEQGVPRQVHGINIDITARKTAELERRQSEARAIRAEEILRTALHYSSTVVWRWNMEEDRMEWWGPVARVYGVEAAELTNVTDYRKVVLPADLPALQQKIVQNRLNGAEIEHEFRIVRPPNGDVRWISSRASMLRDEAGQVYGMTGVNFDITDRKRVEEELKRSELGFRELTNVVPQIIFTADATGQTTYVNERFVQLSGCGAIPDPHSFWPDLILEEDRPRVLQAWSDSVATGCIYQIEFRLWDSPHGQYRWNLVRAVAVRDVDGSILRWIGATTDIHDQKTAAERLETEVQNRTLDLNQSLGLLRQREEQLEKSLLEKDALLREIHHRVKNNLQIVSSLLSMQASNAGNSAAVAALHDSGRRISSMAMIHEQLYGTEDMQTVEFAEHARRLSQSLLASMAGNPFISCRLDLNPVYLTIHQAIPCALILNELLTNAFKYAYPNAEIGGEITVHLSEKSGVVCLAVSDKGIGLPVGVNPHCPTTLGLEIVKVLVDQLDGELLVAVSPGASFTVSFPLQDGATDSDKQLSRSASTTRN